MPCKKRISVTVDAQPCIIDPANIFEHIIHMINNTEIINMIMPTMPIMRSGLMEKEVIPFNASSRLSMNEYLVVPANLFSLL